ncbi:MAG: tripartite tricarboxylate transporter family receptor [Hyphomicrobiales bacterium]|nr:tripartite tricarboxylate transporter family receptor [Hyphomicrobiales bacterium]
MKTTLKALPVLAGALCAGAAQAQTVEQFYTGKTMELIVGYPPGGSNDVYGRAVARNIGRFIAGRPQVVFRNMPGAGSILAANHIYNVAPRDGTVLGLLAATNTLDEKLGATGVKFETSKFTWVGRVAAGTNVTAVWRTSKIQTIKDAFTTEAALGATGTGSTVFIYPNVLNRVLGTKFKMVMGYGGSNEAMLAMERGEVEGHSTSLEAYKSAHPAWLKDGTVRVVVQYGLTRHPDLPDVPTCLEIATNDEQRRILGAVVNATEIGKAILSTPAVPADRTRALRDAFMEMTRDAEFQAELEKMRVELTPMSGEKLQALVQEVGDMPPELITKIKAVYGGG